MFPSAANIAPVKDSTNLTSNDSWLHSSSYQQSTLNHISPEIGGSRKKRKHKKRHNRSRSPTPITQADSTVNDPDLYYVDRSSNRNIYRYGSIYEGDVAKFHPQTRVPILGTHGTLRLLDFDPKALKDEIKRNRRKRYFSKKNRARLVKKGLSVRVQSESSEETIKPYISLLEHSTVLPLEEPIPERSVNLKKIADLNRTVYESPNNIKSWLELVEIQLFDEAIEDDGLSPEGHRLLVLERQIAILERAVNANPGNFRLRILLVAMREFATELIASGVRRISSSSALEGVQLKDQVAKEWSQLVFMCPQFVSVWRGYLAHLRGRFSMFSLNAPTGIPKSAFSRIESVYRRAITTLSGIISGRILSHKPNAETADQTIDLLAEYCHWLSQTGFTERAFTIWQAVVEFVCYCPPKLQSIHTTLTERQLEFRCFWMSENRGTCFGLPGARGWTSWYCDKGTDIGNGARSSPGIANAVAAYSAADEIEEEWGSAPSASRRWNRITQDWNGVFEAAEDALLEFNGQSHEENSNSTQTANQIALNGNHSGDAGANLISRQSRGLAWLGLERARESVGWLPACATLRDTSVVEDSDRLTKFEEIEPCLLEVTLDQTAPDTAVIDKRKQRLILLFLEFLGVWDADIAGECRLPADLQQVHEISRVSFLQRQRINARQVGFPWLRASFEVVGGASNITFRMRFAIAGSALEQASHLFPTDRAWQSVIGRLRFQHLTSYIEQALVCELITAKTALTLWKKKAKCFLSVSSFAQSDLSLWLAYAQGLRQTAFASSTDEEKSLFFDEARKVFSSTLRMYPVPAHSPSVTLEHQLNVLLPRLKVLHAFLDFELSVRISIKKTQAFQGKVHFDHVAHALLQHATTGGNFVPSPVDTQSNASQFDFVTTGTQLFERLEVLRLTVSGIAHFNHTELPITSICELAAIWGSLILSLQLLAVDESNMVAVCKLIFAALRDIDDACVSSLVTTTRKRRCRWSPEDSWRVPAGYASRRFLRLALPGITGMSLLCQRNRCTLVEAFLGVFGTCFATDEVPPLVGPFEWTQLLPYKVAASFGAQVSKITCSIEYQRNLQGLLPPLILSSLESRFDECVRRVCQCVASHLTATSHKATVGRRKNIEGDEEGGATSVDPSVLLGYFSVHQSELLGRVLPSCLDLLCVGLELEHWTSLVAGAADHGLSDPLSHCWIRGAIPRIRNAFEKALSASSKNPLVRFGKTSIPSLALTMSPTLWVDHLRTVLWSAYMAFEWNVAAGDGGGFSILHAGSQQNTRGGGGDVDAHRKQRTAFKAIFYRAVEDLPWAKMLYTDLARYCPEDVEEVVDLLTSRELRLRTPMEEVDLLLTTHRS